MDVRELCFRLVRYVIILFWAGKALAGTTDPNTPDDKYVEFGKSFPSVVRIKNTLDCKKCQKVHEQSASAVVIRPHWVLTAAHVVKDATGHIAVKDGKEYPLVYAVAHKDYDEDKVGWHDIALAYSPEDFKLEFYTPLYKQSDEKGKAITIAGYGLHGTFTTGAKESDGRKRAGHNKIDSADMSVLFCSPSVSQRFPLEFGLASGDSGGGMFIENALAGINSFVTASDGKPNGSYGDESAFTRVSLYVDWVDEQIKKHELAVQARATTDKELP